MSTQRHTRAPRVSVPNKEQAVVSIDAEQFTGTLCLLSRTGGTIRLPKLFAAGTFADIGIKTVSGTFLATIELLRMVRGNAQAFRFVTMGPTARRRLEDALKKMHAQGLRVKKANAWSRLLKHAGCIITRLVLVVLVGGAAIAPGQQAPTATTPLASRMRRRINNASQVCDCRQFCSCQILKEPQSSKAFNERAATGSIMLNHEETVENAEGKGRNREEIHGRITSR